MKQYSRPAPPYELNHETNKEIRERIIQWYERIKTKRKSEDITDYWRTRNDIKKAIQNLSNGHCCYCGKMIECTIDHYLPKVSFPFLTYCWDNLFPSCRSCNEAKSGYVPQELQNQELIDPILADREDFTGEAFHYAILQNIGERIFHPILDSPEAHIDFDVANLKFIVREDSSIGNVTIERILSVRHEATEFAEEIGRRVKYIEKLFAEQIYQYNEIIELGLAEYEGYEFIIRKTVDYWAQFYTNT